MRFSNILNMLRACNKSQKDFLVQSQLFHKREISCLKACAIKFQNEKGTQQIRITLNYILI